MKIAICTPCHTSAKPAFVEALGNLVALTTRSLPHVELNVRIRGSSSLPALRTALADWALQWGADYILFVDSDQVFEPDALLRLLSHGKPIVAANIARRNVPTGPTASKVIDNRLEWVWTTQEQAGRGEVEEVDRVGFGMVLIADEVFKSIPQPWFAIEDRSRGEDYFFCAAARREGFPIFVDHAVSWGTGHLHEIVFTMDATLHDRAEFEKMRPRP